ncbi:MAG TPA: bifunctional (p)ppGpp synthetase/guanosine-3',5'-bis(diphosphate) 3'-pyrophosphohydrolase [Bryobacteraceae bacterium]|jgi:GTP diphosphokinase / guanosine-3',5'-bis(diphosphate) 3'-diphosphatase|nr:bifunctional (p)ppGpp synthetase/guanosine-3',5'-bis(diphosphate) 3'-pyrophosphohydrolase [Bryobacteraceae bacterium]
MTDSTQAVDIPAAPASQGQAVAEAGSETAVTDPVGPLYAELERRVHALRPNEDLTALRKAFEFAAARHLGQKRVSGEPYMVHPLMVTLQLADMHMDLVCLETGLLHDVVEDTTATLAEVKKEFGDDVARVVDGVTKLSKLNLASREERQAESVRKMLLAMVNDIRVIMVKLADRLHNMRTLSSLSPERQERIAAETMEIYAPIAHRLGMGKIRAELEDLAFRILEPEASTGLLKEFEAAHADNERFLKEIKHTVEQLLAREGIPARVEGRLKRAYSVFQKLKRQKIGLDQVYDLLAVRIVTDSVKNCYAALGVIHNEWHPIPGRIKDFIAIPRPNLYQSLHTSVMGPGGRHFEVQIRTEEMHRVAEEGIAAHWKYKEGRRGAEDDQRITWLRQLVEWQREMHDPGEFMSTLKVDLYPEEVYTFTPKGRVITLPRDATPIDFAYAIHSDVGNTCTGAKVNGRIVQLKYGLRNGDVVEILTQSGHLPSKDWLALVKTSRARNKIKHVINTTERVKAIEIGQKYLEREARRFGVALSRITEAQMTAVASDYGVSKIEDLHAALGYGKYSARQVLQKLAPDQVSPETPAVAPVPEPIQGAAPAQRYPGGDQDLIIKVKGIDDLLVYRAKCCNPIRGEAIVGYVTRGKGVAVHSLNCTNVQNLMYEVERKIDVEWARAASETFQVKLLIHTEDRPGILNQLTQALFGEQINIRSLEARGDDERAADGAIIDVTVEVRDKKQLERVVSAVRRISGVRDIERINQ